MTEVRFGEICVGRVRTVKARTCEICMSEVASVPRSGPGHRPVDRSVRVATTYGASRTGCALRARDPFLVPLQLCLACRALRLGDVDHAQRAALLVVATRDNTVARGDRGPRDGA